jgi:hypothetical protein
MTREEMSKYIDENIVEEIGFEVFMSRGYPAHMKVLELIEMVVKERDNTIKEQERKITMALNALKSEMSSSVRISKAIQVLE